MALRNWFKRHPRAALLVLYAIVPLIFVQILWDSLCALGEGACESWADNWREFRATRDDVQEKVKKIRHA